MAKVVNCSEVFESTQCHRPAFSSCQIGDAKGDGMSSVNSFAAAEKVKWFSPFSSMDNSLPPRPQARSWKEENEPPWAQLTEARRTRRWGHLRWGGERPLSREASVCTVGAKKPKARCTKAQMIQEVTGFGSRFLLGHSVSLWCHHLLHYEADTMLCIPEAAFCLKSIKLCSALTGVKLFMNQGHSSLLPSNNPAIQWGLHLTSTLSGDVCLNVCVCVLNVCVCIYVYIYIYIHVGLSCWLRW